MVAGIRDYHTEFQEIRSSDFPIVSKDGILLMGQVYTRGSVLAKLNKTATPAANVGKLVMATNAAAPTDGSADIFAVLMDDVDATLADAPCRVNITGEYSDLTLVFKAGGYTASTAEDYLRSVHSSIFIHKVTPLQEVNVGG